MPDLHTAREPIAVTGVGVACALGSSLEELMERMLAGESGIRSVHAFDPTPYPIQLAGELERLPVPTSRALPPQADRSEQILAGVAEQALRQAGLVPGASTGLILGTTLGGLCSGGEFLLQWRRHGAECASMALIGQNFPAAQLSRLAAHCGVTGPVLGLSNACASGADAIGAAVGWLRRGRADAVLAGGYDPMAEFTFAGFSALKLVTASSCRPFARDRDGFHLGEGAALLLLERESAAQQRGARILARVLGHGSAAEAHHLTQPEPTGAGGARAIAAALVDAGVTAGHVVHVNAHGTASPANDRSEFLALRRVFGERLRDVPVTASKAALGHTLGAAGALEAAVVLGTFWRGRIPPTLNTIELDPELLELDLVRGASRPLALGAHPNACALSNSFGFGGSCSALILGGGDDAR